MLIRELKKSSLIDYPEKISAVIFTQVCNFRCHYCHNPDLFALTSCSSINEQDVMSFLQTRKQKIDAVVISGGEPCLQKDLVGFIKKIKDMDFLVKLDTNGSFPDKLEAIINLKLVDYIAMDIKSPLNKYKNIVNSDVDINNILKTGLTQLS